MFSCSKHARQRLNSQALMFMNLFVNKNKSANVSDDLDYLHETSTGGEEGGRMSLLISKNE